MANLMPDNWTITTGDPTDVSQETSTTLSGESALKFDAQDKRVDISSDLIPVRSGYYHTFDCWLQASSASGTFTIWVEGFDETKSSVGTVRTVAASASVGTINTWEQFSNGAGLGSTVKYIRLHIDKESGTSFSMIVDRFTVTLERPSIHLERHTGTTAQSFSGAGWLGGVYLNQEDFDIWATHSPGALIYLFTIPVEGVYVIGGTVRATGIADGHSFVAGIGLSGTGIIKEGVLVRNDSGGTAALASSVYAAYHFNAGDQIYLDANTSGTTGTIVTAKSQTHLSIHLINQVEYA